MTLLPLKPLPPLDLPEGPYVLSDADAFGLWFSGFFDGEGTLGIFPPYRVGRGNGYRCSAKISLRADDQPILDEIHARLGIGRIYADRKGWASAASKTTNPCISWAVDGREPCLRLMEFFERYPLRAKKARDFAIWAEGVREWTSVPVSTKPRDWTRMAELCEGLRAARVFKMAA
jgi:hypothetical protein